MRQGKLSQHLHRYCDKAIMFCMPSHNGTLELSTALDVTELSFSDNLMDAKGIILQCEQDIAKAYGANHAMMFTAGATSAIATALALVKSIGDTVIIDSRAHKSVYSYAQMLGLTLINIHDIPDLDNFSLGGILVTTPDYFGNTYDITLARELATRYNIPLVIDQSHGGHFAFSSLLPCGNENVGDIVINSLHKTLPVLTGGAIVLVNAQYYPDMLLNRAKVHSSSPSYLTMVSIDNAVADFAENGERYYRDIRDMIAQFKAILNSNYCVMDNDDYSRLVIKSTKYRGIAVQKVLQDHNIYIEMVHDNLLVLIVTPYNYTLLITVAEVLNNIEQNNMEQFSSTSCTQPFATNIIQEPTTAKSIILLSPRQAMGQIAATNVGIYPPGIPVIVQGQTITKQNIQTILDNEGELFGMIADKIPCIRSK